jgi:hypothetical protein
MIRQVQLRLVLYSKTARAKKNWTKTWRARANDGFFSSVSSSEKPLRHLPDSPRSSEYAKGDRCESHVGRGEKRSLIGRGNGVTQIHSRKSGEIGETTMEARRGLVIQPRRGSLQVEGPAYSQWETRFNDDGAPP